MALFDDPRQTLRSMEARLREEGPGPEEDLSKSLPAEADPEPLACYSGEEGRKPEKNRGKTLLSLILAGIFLAVLMGWWLRWK